ncbi:ThiF family adenylyltransferase [Alkalihalobacillus sp. LMS39]|uniref:ThiF family adenylyltransferase n=1 Tax=Alkalihalobacillus sp. LMS39 TaxID=2924032 RepID=UPI001FB324A9|nr:ThiF family adenylyltransferase [Alkalihalobacillus sp. LMS39]UOE95725.1 ThiF family adenylyltransferase [Alkalihalobacillus sp. LMS39]
MEQQRERYSRQMLFSPIGEEGQALLLEKKVLIVGMGALGTVLASHLVRAGVGTVIFADRDYVEKSNLQRQVLFDEDDVAEALPKAVAAERKLRKINSDITIQGIVTDVTRDNMDELLDSVDLVLDGTDNFQTRFLINDACFKKGIPFVYGGAVSSRGMTAIFIPGETPCLRCFIKEGDTGGQTCDMIGVISPVVDIVGSFQAVEAIKYLVQADKSQRKSLLSFDIWNYHMFELKFSKPDHDCPTCQLREYPALQIEDGEMVTSLCGRETVQINARPSFDLKEWAKKLQVIGKVKETPFLLRVELDNELKLVLFPDGRTLVQGTEDVAEAKAIYRKYIGL